MKENRQSTAKRREMRKPLSFVKPTDEAESNRWTPEYVRTRTGTIRQRAILDSATNQTCNSLQNKDKRKKAKVSKELFPSTKDKTEHFRLQKKQEIGLNTRWPTGYYSEDECERLPDINDDLLQLEGYESENEKETLYEIIDTQPDKDFGDWFICNNTDWQKMLLYHGQRFKDVVAFRRALQVFAIREGFNLCVMENRSHFVSCECSDLSCDWLIKAARVINGKTFVITEIVPQHKCGQHRRPFQYRSKWISAMYLHRWKAQPNISTLQLMEEIEATYSCKCSEWKLFCAANRAKHILGIDHEDGYSMLNQFKEEMERIDTDNIVRLETEYHELQEGERFKRMFVCCERTAYAFKNNCRGLLAVDGWKLNNPYGSVMLVAAGLDGNNGILPVAFCEVEVEDLESWVYFLKNINNALRLENGKGLCILGDGDNDIEYAVEEFLSEATYRQCCHRIFSEMVKRFPTAPVQYLFWSACRSSSATTFFKYMKLISNESQQCHDWLAQSNWERWALFCMPQWVKCTCVTLTITNKLRNAFDQYLEISIARRFAIIARVTADIFEQRRMLVWKWYQEKVTPTVQHVLHDRCIDGQRFSVLQHNGPALKLTDSNSGYYHLNMEVMTCSCGLWQISGIPCAHACRGIDYIGANVEEYVDNMMSVQNYMSTYAPGMTQLPKEYAWQWHKGHSLLPPVKDHVVKGSLLKPTDDVTPNKVVLHPPVQSFSTAHDPQSTQSLTIPNSSHEDETLIVISTSSDDTISF